ncbi:alanine/glycine:cation symporter family protein [Atopobacter phocae]|uniref:alanine/glycine:cation symporter family protein n=1 Tax=Atopobacter phocae TaxID=136492 RepID=UPI000472DAF0|nr:alanine/glycine:cation symporter family protein [Atopobacter phocae]
MIEYIDKIIQPVTDVLYFPILIILLLGTGLFFTFRTRLIQVRLLKEGLRVIMERPSEGNGVSSFQALMVSTASRVGTGNIVGVSTALCLGGYGAVFWMWLVAVIGGASAFIESTLAQIYKRKNLYNQSYGGPAYYIEIALKNRKLGVIFAVFLILTYAVGFNMLAAYNMQDSFRVYEFYDASVTPILVGGFLSLVTGYCLFGGGQRIIKFTSFLVPMMGIVFVTMSLIMVATNLSYMPTVLRLIMQDAFDFKAIFGGIAGSSMMYGIKRGLYSNEAGIGSAPNAAAVAQVSHPVKQGLVQMISVFIDTIIICSATAFMCLSSGIVPAPELSGALYIQMALGTFMGSWGNYFITMSLSLFGFTTLIGNLFYVDSNLTYILGKVPRKSIMIIYHLIAVVLIFVGALQEQGFVWHVADLLMALLALINLPSILILSPIAIKVLNDYTKQRRANKEPVFIARNIGLDDSLLDFWK